MRTFPSRCMGTWSNRRFAGSPIRMTDSGNLRVVKQVPGGTVDPGTLVSGLARSAEALGVQILLSIPKSRKLKFPGAVAVDIKAKTVRSRDVLLATNAMSLEMSDLVPGRAAKFTGCCHQALAMRTARL